MHTGQFYISGFKVTGMHTDRLTAFELKRNHETAAVEGVDVRLLCFVVNQRLLKERELVMAPP